MSSEADGFSEPDGDIIPDLGAALAARDAEIACLRSELEHAKAVLADGSHHDRHA